MRALGDRRLLRRAGVALIKANARYWPSVFPFAVEQLERWEDRARAIEDPQLRGIALAKLRRERFNAEVAATLATIVPTEHRRSVIEAIVAYEVLYDYLDELTEPPTDAPLLDREQLYLAFLDAVAVSPPSDHAYYARHAHDDGGYLRELVSTVRGATARLPARTAVADAVTDAARRCAEAQIRGHAIPQLGTAQLERWAQAQAGGEQLPWRQYMAGSAASVLSIHALIAAAADERTTIETARALDATYLSICAVSTLLDGLVDYEQDLRDRGLAFLRYYERRDELSHDLAECARRAVRHATRLRDGAHHTMTLVGVAAYYMSAPTARSPGALPVTRDIRRELEPLMTPTLAVMRGWRTAKRIRSLASIRRRRPSVPARDPRRGRSPTRGGRSRVESGYSAIQARGESGGADDTHGTQDGSPGKAAIRW